MAETFSTGGLFNGGDRIGEDLEGESLALRPSGGGLFSDEEGPEQDPDVQGKLGSRFTEDAEGPETDGELRMRFDDDDDLKLDGLDLDGDIDLDPRRLLADGPDDPGFLD